MKAHPLFEWSGEPYAGPQQYGLRVLLALACCGFASVASASGAAGPQAAEQWQTIHLESDCFGCPEGRRLSFQADGTASLTLVGKPRLGTTDRTRQARLPPGAFEHLAAQLRAQGFLQMQDVYQQEDLRDGAWTTLEVQGLRGGQPFTKSVFAREEAAPAALQVLFDEALRIAASAGLQ